MGRRDQEILDLCRAGDQQAIAAMEKVYGSYCYKVEYAPEGVPCGLALVENDI